jgi:hypothetical protein
MTKLTVNRLTHALDDLASHMDVDQFALASMSEDHKEGMAAFRERRKPRFRGRQGVDDVRDPHAGRRFQTPIMNDVHLTCRSANSRLFDEMTVGLRARWRDDDE